MKIKTWKRWRCPKCGATYTGPIGASAVACAKKYHGDRREPVAMRPITQEEST